MPPEKFHFMSGKEVSFIHTGLLVKLTDTV
jgi:hypothetical protein